MKEMYIYFMAYKNIKDDKYYFSPKVLDFLNNVLYRILSGTGRFSCYFLLFFALKYVSFANSITQKSAYSLTVHILYVILRIICI